jgi:hypothetical protein
VGCGFVTVEPPIDSYPGTDYVNAFFTVSIDSSLSEGECEKFADDPLATRKLTAVKKISGIEFHSARVAMGDSGINSTGSTITAFQKARVMNLRMAWRRRATEPLTA